MIFPRQSGRYDLLGTEAYRNLLARNLSVACRSITIISAFITISGLRWVRDKVARRDIPVTIVTQWSPGDLLSGGSDLSAYSFARQQNWRFRILSKLHAKVLLIDGKELFVGSANVTAFGLSLVPGGNRELGLYVAANEVEVRTVAGLIEESIEMTPELYSHIKNWLDEHIVSTQAATKVEWPEFIGRAMVRPPARLWVADLPWADPHALRATSETAVSSDLREAIDHDIRLYGADDPMSLERAFSDSVGFRWLIKTLETEPGQLAYFGRLSEQLHSSLFDDPSPFRKDVKHLLSNLLEYVRTFARSEIEITRPQQSMRVKLLTSNK